MSCYLLLPPGGGPSGSPGSSFCRSNKSPWVCLTCLNVHCGRYVNGHAKQHYEDSQSQVTGGGGHKRCEEQEKEKHAQHLVCMDCSSYSLFCYRCDDFVVNDTKLGHVQKVREHLRSLENSPLAVDRRTKRKLLESNSPTSKLLKDNGGASALSAMGLRNLGNTCFMNAILQSLSNIQQFSCYFMELPAVALRSGKTAGRRMYHTRSQGDTTVSLVEELRKTLCYLWQGGPTAFSPDSLFYVVWKIMPSFRGYQQQDAHEFMRYLLDHLHRELQGGLNGAEGPALPVPPDSVTVSADNPTLPQDGLALPQDEVKLPITGAKCRMVQQVSTSGVNVRWLFIADHSEYPYRSCCL
uniref:ubiquitinyl hydrolase 1 n=1 Tax=Hucho hucho TaxID=62062 RepID=A0A4W5KS88_9TELE